MKNHKIKIIFLIVLTFLVYSNIYQNQFISDDINGLVENPLIKDFTQTVKSLSVYNIIRSINYQIGGLNPTIYHLTNVLFHCANSILVYVIVYMLPFWKKDNKDNTGENNSQKSWIALTTASLFAVHPIETEVVTWISGGGYAVYVFFLLISFTLILYYLQNLKSTTIKKLTILSISGLSYVLALFSSLKAIMFPVLILSLLFVYPTHPLRKIKNIWRYIPILMMILMISVFFIFTIKSGIYGRALSMTQFPIDQRKEDNLIFQTIIALGSYSKLFFFPINLTFYHTEIIPQFVFRIFMGIVTLMGIVIAVSIKKAPVIFFSLMWFLITLSPNLVVIPLAWVVAERYVYIGSIGFFLFVSYVLYKIGEKWNIQEVITGVVISIIIILIPLTYMRNSDWKDADTLWPKTAESSPNSAQAHNNMGDYYTRHKNYKKAIEEFSLAIDLGNGYYPAAIHNLATIYFSLKETTTAAKLYEKAITQNPNLIESYAQLALIAIQQNNLGKAEEYCQKMIKINPNYAPAYEYLGIIMNIRGNKTETLINLKKALLIDPENKMYQNNLNLLQKQ